MMDIKEVLLRSANNEVKQNEQLAKELHKPIFKKF